MCAKFSIEMNSFDDASKLFDSGITFEFSSSFLSSCSVDSPVEFSSMNWLSPSNGGHSKCLGSEWLSNGFSPNETIASDGNPRVVRGGLNLISCAVNIRIVPSLLLAGLDVIIFSSCCSFGYKPSACDISDSLVDGIFNRIFNAPVDNSADALRFRKRLK